MKNSKFPGIPSKGFVEGQLKKHVGQRATFTLSPDSFWYMMLRKSGFDEDTPVKVNGIYSGLWKRPENWPNNWGHNGPMQFVLIFRGCVFLQGDKKGYLFTDRKNKRHATEFPASHIVELFNVPFETLAAQPKLLGFS